MYASFSVDVLFLWSILDGIIKNVGNVMRNKILLTN